LKMKGYFLKPDGFFGLKTERALRRFQQDHNLTVTGIVGTKEQKLLNLDLSGDALPTAKPDKAKTLSPKTGNVGIFATLVGKLRALVLSISRPLA